MILRNNPKCYRWILLLSFVCLCVLVGFLTFNTYQYKDRDFQKKQKELIEKSYSQYIMQDKLYPGGSTLFAAYLEPSLPAFLETNGADVRAYHREKEEVTALLFSKLRAHQNMDKIFAAIQKRNQLDSALLYSLVFEKLELYEPSNRKWNALFVRKEGDTASVIAGSLQKINANNRVLSLSVSEDAGITYRFQYALYVDYPNRFFRVLKEMLPVFSFSVICILLIIWINYLTFQNWVKQKKEAELKTDFLHHIRHEFNTPITTLLVCANTLQEQQQLITGEGIGVIGQVVERQASRLKRYFKQVLESVSIQEQSPYLEDVAISTLTESLLHDISLSYAGSIQIKYTPLEADLSIALDPALYFSILDNLVSNAFKFNQNKQPQVYLFWRSENNKLLLCIKDNGIGVKPEETTHIFEKFYRSKLAGNRSGLGLGLYYVKSCTARLGWDISLSRNEEEGSLFVIRMNNRKK